MTVTIDRRIFNDAVISKAVYWLSGEYKVNRQLIDKDLESLSIDSRIFNVDDKDIEIKLMRLLNDFKLRQIVADETRDIKTILYAKAFAEDEELSEEDIHD